VYYTAPSLPCFPASRPLRFQIRYSSFNLRVLYTSSFPSFSLTSSSSSNVSLSPLSVVLVLAFVTSLHPCIVHTLQLHSYSGLSALNSLNIRKQNLIHPLNHPSHCAIPSSRQQLRFCFANRPLSITITVHSTCVTLPIADFLVYPPCFLFSTLSSSQFAFLFRHLRSFLCEDQPVRYSGLRRIRKTEGMDHRRRSFANQRLIVNSRYNLSPPKSLHVAKLQATYST